MGKLVSAFSDDALGTMDAVGVAEAIATKKVSIEEVTEAAIERAEKVNGVLDAIVLKTYDDARKKMHLNENGLLYGVPSFIKDNENLQGYPTQKGTGAFISKPAKKNSKYVRQFFHAGVNCIGKTTLPEFGFICSTENERWNITRNPWNTEYTTGGSSSGSAALVASGVVPIAIANDGAGSTRIPASCCGLVGLKPTRDRLMPMHGTETLPINIVYSGVVTRSVRDTAAFYAAAEQFYKNPKLPEIGHVKNPLTRRLRIVIFDNLPEGKQGHVDADTWNTMMETSRLLESLGHTVDTMPLPLDPEELTIHYLTYYGFLSYMTVNLGRFVTGGKVNKEILEPFTVGLKNTFRDNKLRLPKSLSHLKKAASKTESDLAQKYDIVMTPVSTITTPKIGYFSPKLDYDEVCKRASDFATYLPLFNISGSPTISIPMGTSSEGMPIGLQFAAPHGQDKLLLELALELEAAKPWKFIYEM